MRCIEQTIIRPALHILCAVIVYKYLSAFFFVNFVLDL